MWSFAKRFSCCTSLFRWVCFAWTANRWTWNWRLELRNYAIDSCNTRSTRAGTSTRGLVCSQGKRERGDMCQRERERERGLACAGRRGRAGDRFCLRAGGRVNLKRESWYMQSSHLPERNNTPYILIHQALVYTHLYLYTYVEEEDLD